MFRVQPQGFLELTSGFLMAAEMKINRSDIVVRFWIGWIQSRCLAQCRERVIDPAECPGGEG